MKNKQIKAGDVFATNEGGSVVVIEYINSRNIMIRHSDSYGHEAITTAGQLRNGGVKNPYFPSVYGVGFAGVGKYSARPSGRLSAAYQAWANMLRRCYYQPHIDKYPTYADCSVCVDWHNFQSFAEWFYNQDYSDMADFALDKDLIVMGNRVYSPSMCSYIPRQINTLLISCSAARGSLPQGVYFDKQKGSFCAQVRVNGDYINLGRYATPEQAFSVYKKAKEENVRSMAVEWREYLHPTVYANLMAYEV